MKDKKGRITQSQNPTPCEIDFIGKGIFDKSQKMRPASHDKPKK